MTRIRSTLGHTRRTFVAGAALALMIGACSANPSDSSVAGRGQSSAPSSVHLSAQNGATVASSEKISVELASRMPIFSEEIPEKDQKRWVMPTDIYTGRVLGKLASDAEIVGTVQCMRASGYPDYPLHIKLFQPEDAVMPWGASNKIFNEEIAAKYGYRMDGNGDYVEGVTLPDPATMPPEFDQTWKRCTMEAARRVRPHEVAQIEKEKAEGLPETEAEIQAAAEKAQQSIGSKLNRLGSDPTLPQLLDAAARWRECMAPLGIPDLPERPWRNVSRRMPESLQIRWQWETSGQPSADEIAVATHDAACRRSSGWFDALYEAEWAVREEFVNTHRDELAPIVEEQRAQAKAALEVLAAYEGQ